MGGKVYVLSVFDTNIDYNISEPRVIGVYLHRSTACRKIIRDIERMEIYERVESESSMKIISQIRPYYYGKYSQKKGYKYDDYVRGMYWRITTHHLK
jgi:hypothetical protein